MMDNVRLTQFSHGAGCGCKISPAVLDKILHTDLLKTNFPKLLVGNDTKDDAAVFEIGDGLCIVSTTDFFMPIVDDPQTFGAIASVNAISDIYAMGGEPFMAIAILGWPINKIPPEVAKAVLEGSRQVCQKAGIPLAGGHSIDCPEPVFGLAVTGKVKKENLKRNDTAHEGSLLYLTKPLGIGIITTAQKKGIVQLEHYTKAVKNMLMLNTFGFEVSQLHYVTAMTDVTGFGLLGHLCEMCEGSGVSAEIKFDKVPKFDSLSHYINLNCVPGGTARNWESYRDKVALHDLNYKNVLADPQTSGGLLIAVKEIYAEAFESLASINNQNIKPFGRLIARGEKVITVY